MIYRGQFYSLNNQLYSVVITDSGSDSTIIEIGDDDTGVFFAGNPLEISMDGGNLMNTILTQSCTINLVTKDFIADRFFSDNYRSISVKVRKGNYNGSIIFDGYLDAEVAKQPYCKPYDSFSITAYDKLSTLQYYNYKNINVNNFNQLKSEAGYVTMREAIETMFADIKENGVIYHDNRLTLNKFVNTSIFDELAIPESKIIGDEFDDVKNNQEVLDAILKYVNCHIIQIGSSFYIFNLDSVKNKNNRWYNLLTHTQSTKTPKTIDITQAISAGNNTSIDVDDVYNQIKLTCDLDSVTTLVESPLDSKTLQSDYSNKIMYMREYISEGEGNNAIDAFKAMVLNQRTNYDNCKFVDWYYQVLKSRNWKITNAVGDVNDLVERDANGVAIKEWRTAQRLRDYLIEPAIISIGKNEYEGGRITDDEPVGKVSMSNYLVIGVNGNEIHDEDRTSPSEHILQSVSPILEYNGGQSGVVYSPTDNESTNYLVINGKLTLSPIQKQTDQFDEVYRHANEQDKQGIVDYIQLPNGQTQPIYDWVEGIRVYWHQTVPSDNNGDGRYYTRRWHRPYYVGDTENDNLYGYGNFGLNAPDTTAKSEKKYQFNYSYCGDIRQGTDSIPRLDILECELIIGNKRLIEVQEYHQLNMDLGYHWVEIGSEPTFVIDGESYKLTSFPLSINPKLGDYIIGDEHSIRNTITLKMNLDMEGTAIPIKRSDKLSGKVTFRVLGCCNTIWNQISRRHPTFFRHTKWTQESKFILADTEAIWIKDFNIQIASDNSGNSSDYQDLNNDLVYVSDEQTKYLNINEESQFEFITQPTAEECAIKGIPNQILSNVVVGTDNMPINTLYGVNNNEVAKAEEFYVDQYYRYYSSPKVVINTDIEYNSDFNFFNSYNYPLLNKVTMVRGYTIDLLNDKLSLNLREL